MASGSTFFSTIAYYYFLYKIKPYLCTILANRIVMTVDLFIPCDIDQFHPEVALATVKVLRKAGVEVELFSSAACIVGSSGAALANVVYCNPGTVLGCVIPRKYEFCIYSSIAHVVGCKELFYDAKVSKAGSAISNEQCIVDLNECKQYIRKLDLLVD